MTGEHASQPHPHDRFSERELTILRLMADGLSNQEIADRRFLAVATVKWYIRQINDKLDTHSRTQTVARAYALHLIQGPKSEPNSVPGVVVEEPESLDNPYKGLRAFHEADKDDFFGRDTLVRRLVTRLWETEPIGTMSRFLAVVGPSGSGKSSVANAGLIPALRRGDVPGSDTWRIVSILPGEHPLDELEIALLRLASNSDMTLGEQLRRDERGLVRAARLVLPDENSKLLLVIDQFEEVFALVNDPAERNQVLNLIHAGVIDPRSPLHVIVTLRADFFERPLLHAAFGELMRQRTEIVLPMSIEELEQAIIGPAARVGVTLEPGLTATMAAAIHQQPGALPLLQYTLTELFERRQNNRLTLDAYHAIGGVLGALARRAYSVYEQFDARHREATRQVFLRLVTLGEGIEDTRRRVSLDELLSIGADAETTDEVIQTFASFRLLTLDRDAVTQTPTVELAHEAIIREWSLLRTWLDESRADVRLQRLLANAVAEWEAAGRDAGFLLSGSRLVQFEAWATAAPVALTAAEWAYLDASLAERVRQTQAEQTRQARERKLERRSRNFLRGLVAVLLLASLGAFGLTGVAVNQSELAQRSEAEARALYLASAAQLALNEGNIDQAVALAQAALQSGPNAPALAQRVLDEASYAPGTQRLFRAAGISGSGVLETQGTPLRFMLVGHMPADFFFSQIIIRGMEDACDFVNASCQWLGPPSLDVSDLDVQVAARWSEALASNPAGIGTTMAIPDAIRSGLEQAAQRGIPVVAFNVAETVDTDSTLPSLLYIGSNEFVAGQTNARRVLFEARTDGVAVGGGVCTNQAVGMPALDAYCVGVKSVFDEAGIPVEQLPITDDPTIAAREMVAYFAQKSEVNAILVSGPGPAAAFLGYMEQSGRSPGDLYAATRDVDPGVLDMIRDGYLLQAIDQQPYIQGFQTIISLYLEQQYGLRPSGYMNTSSVIDRSNVDLITELTAAGYR